MLLQVREERVHLALLFSVPAVEELDDPPFVDDRHPTEEPAAAGCELHRECTAIGRMRRTPDQAFRLELIGDARHVRAGHHQALRQFAHGQAVVLAFELGEQVEPRQGRRELAAQTIPDHAFDTRRARQQSQPELEGLVVRVLHA